MTADENPTRAQRCLRCVIAAIANRDMTMLTDANFTALMRRGLERFAEQTPFGTGLQASDVDWDSYALEGRKSFSDLDAYLHRFTAAGKPMLQLTGLDAEDLVCDFAFLDDLTRTGLPYLKDGAGLQSSPWFSTSLFSTNFKLDALLPGHAGVSYSTRRLGDIMTATVTVPIGYFETLSGPGAKRLLDDLSSILGNSARLSYGAVRPSAMHIILTESPDERRSLRWINGPPKETWLADRLVEMSL